ncbi:uncharacterized protein LOC119689861 [Teleopsis dalmanni]|uniref:uncharacterized protein LOC119689861 n=1 Tax=Teleopsis dalmanni TaxID=139649 RepID=UPI0018CFA175|nr:uncharacterized protein LOC119689861 [Teleopsis dalmanni]
MQLIAARIICYICVIIGFCNLQVQGQSKKVSPKLDFDDVDENTNNSSVPIVPGVGQGRTNNGERHGGGNTGRGSDGSGGTDGSSSTDSTSGGAGGSKVGPKIHGVRVTVDTGDTQKSKESKESVEITDVGKHKKRVGIHTDITFEISTDGEDDTNATSSAQKTDKEDASVPIFKGHNDSRHKSRKPYDPKQHWSPGFSSERHDSTGRSGPSYGNHYPQYPYNVPVYTSGASDTRGGGGNIYRRGDGWNNYIPVQNLWTTERSYIEPFRPNSVTGYQRTPSWKPCYCVQSVVDNRRRRESKHGTIDAVVRPTSSIIKVIDNKLDRPFSK